jgi:hypothetical protein
MKIMHYNLSLFNGGKIIKVSKFRNLKFANTNYVLHFWLNIEILVSMWAVLAS